MAKNSEQNIFDPRLSKSMYSGENRLQLQLVDSYAREFSRVNERAKQGWPTKGIDEKVKTATAGQSKLDRNLTENVRLGDIADEVAELKDRYPTKQVGNFGSTLNPIQEWEGFVDSIGDHFFYVKLSNVNDGTGLPLDEGEFELRELTLPEQSRLRIGSIVRWVVGYEKLANDQRQKVSRLHLRRIPVHTKSDIDHALKDADSLLDGLNWVEASSE